MKPRNVEGIPPARLSAGDIVAVAGMRSSVFQVLDARPGSATVTLQSAQGTVLRVGWKALRWPSEVAS